MSEEDNGTIDVFIYFVSFRAVRMNQIAKPGQPLGPVEMYGMREIATVKPITFVEELAHIANGMAAEMASVDGGAPPIVTILYYCPLRRDKVTPQAEPQDGNGRG